jgi:hypothetical protein
LRIASAENVPHNVSVTNSIRFDSGKAASTRDKIDSRKLPLLLPYQRLRSWLGREDSNLRMAESKSAALPLGYAPPQAGNRTETNRSGRRNIVAGPSAIND